MLRSRKQTGAGSRPYRRRALPSSSIRPKGGAAVTETVATMVIFVPIIVLIVLVVVQASIACVISSKMTQGAHLAARALATQYGTNPSIAADKAMQQSILTNVRLQNYVTDNSQFDVDDSSWQTTTTPPTVTVTCTYLPGVGNPPLAPFPSFDPLGLGRSFKISAAATCRLQ